MDTQGFRKFLAERELSKEEIASSIEFVEKFDMYQKIAYLESIYPLWFKEIKSTDEVAVFESNTQQIVKNLIESTRLSMIHTLL